MKFLLLTLPLLLPFTTATPIKYSPVPPQHHDTCTKDASFTLHAISYSSSEIYSTPSHLAVHDATVSFNLTNSAVSYTARCTASSGQLTDYFYGNIVYTCEIPAEAGAGAGATFTFDRPSDVFGVNATWSCRNALYTGVANGNADLDCKTDFWQNSNWTMGELYSTRTVSCKPVDLALAAKVSKV